MSVMLVPVATDHSLQHAWSAVTPGGSDGQADKTALLLAAVLIDDILEALELWQSLGDVDGNWVEPWWSRHVMPSIGVDLPPSVRGAQDSAEVHRELLAWQTAIVAEI